MGRQSHVSQCLVDMLLRVDSRRAISPQIIQQLELTRAGQGNRNAGGARRSSLRWNFVPKTTRSTLRAQTQALDEYLKRHREALLRLSRSHKCALSILMMMPAKWVSCGTRLPREFLKHIAASGLDLDICTTLLNDEK